MAVYRSRGIVLRSIRYGEADRILDLYTQDAGLISAIAKGIRRTRSRFGGRLEPLSCVDFVAYRGRTLDTITQAEVLHSFQQVRESLPRFEAAGGLVRAVRVLSGGDEVDRRVFNLLYRGLEALETRDSNFEVVEAAFGLKLLVLAGYAPQLDVCMVCGSDPAASGHPRFSPVLGGVLCADCCSTARDAFPLPAEGLTRMELLSKLPLREAGEAGADESVLRAVRSHISAHAPGAGASGFNPVPRPA